MTSQAEPAPLGGAPVDSAKNIPTRWSRFWAGPGGGFIRNSYFIFFSFVLLIWAACLVYFIKWEEARISTGLFSSYITLSPFSPTKIIPPLIFSAFGFALFLSIFILTVIKPALRKYREHVYARIDDELTAAGLKQENVRALARSLRHRARNLWLASWFALFMTFAAIAAGLYLFAVAGSITINDYSSRAVVAAREQDAFHRRVDFELNRLTAWAFANVNERKGDGEEVQRRIEDLKKTVMDRSEAVNNTLRAMDASDQKGNVPLYFLVSTISTRVASALLLIFLVQILISVYRYSVRLQTYYDARADALILAHQAVASELQQIVTILSPEQINFGKTPTAPTEHLAEAIKGAISRVKATKE